MWYRCVRMGQILLFYLMLCWLGSMLLLGNLAVLPLLLTRIQPGIDILRHGMASVRVLGGGRSGETGERG